MNDGETVDALKAVAHPLRLRILRALAGTERSVGEIDDVAGIGQPALSQQLAVLRGAGLVLTRKEAKMVFYRLDEARLSVLTAALAALSGAARPVPSVRQASPSGVAKFARIG